MRIIDTFPGGNIRVQKAEGNSVILKNDLRDTEGDWFYWAFAVEDAPEGEILFRFDEKDRVGRFGAAVSTDGHNWFWSETAGPDESFSYTFTGKEGRVYFAHNMLYRPDRFSDFCKQAGLEEQLLCVSEKGRTVPYVTFGEGEKIILLTARHHACESTGNYVLEGVLKNLLARPIPGFKVVCVPFIDYDGVVDGDQGKNRRPYDHNRDYDPDTEALYASVRAVRKIIDRGNVVYGFDFHSPWHIGGLNDFVYIPQKSIRRRKQMNRFARIFESKTSPDAMGYRAANDLPVEEDWNTYGTPCFGTYLSEHRGAELGFTLETTYFGLGKDRFEPEKALKTGDDFAEALREYIDTIPETAKMSFTGDLLCQTSVLNSGKTENGYDFTPAFAGLSEVLKDADAAVGNMETPLAGEAFGYTNERYAFNTPEEYLKAAARAGMDIFTCANNHVMDRGESAIPFTAAAFKRNGTDFLGILPEENGGRIFYKTIRGTKVALLNATYGTNAFHHHRYLSEEGKNKVIMTQPEEELPGATHLLESNETIAGEVRSLYTPENPLYEAVLKPYLVRIAEDVREAKDNADVVIYCLHSGGQYNAEPDAYTELLVKTIREAGADLIVGLHPHRLQKCDLSSGSPVIYCLGNAVSMDHPAGYDANAVLHVYLKAGKIEKLTFTLMKLNGFSNEPMARLVREGKLPEAELLSEARLFSGKEYTEVLDEYPLYG